MKNLIVCMFLLFVIVSGCEQAEPDNSKYLLKIAALEAENVELKEKGLIIVKAMKESEYPSKALTDFFGSDKFWKNTVDVGFSECSKQCAKTNRIGMDACEAETDPIKKEICEANRRQLKKTCDSTCVANYNVFP